MMGRPRQIKDYLASVTEKHSARIILIKEDLSHIYAIQEALIIMDLSVCMPIVSWKEIKHLQEFF